MKKILYTRPDGGVSIVIPAAKKNIENVLGKKLTERQYRNHIKKVSIPKDAINVREINDKDLPANRDYRDAWVDITPDSKIDVDAEKVKNIRLRRLRVIRDRELVASDAEMVRALESGDIALIDEVKAKRKNLRNATEPLKKIKITSSLNNKILISRIEKLGVLK